MSQKTKPLPPEPARPTPATAAAQLALVQAGMERIRRHEAKSVKAALGWRKLSPESQAYLGELLAWVDTRSVATVDRVEKRLPGFRGLGLGVLDQLNLMKLWLVERWLQGETLQGREAR